MIIIKDTNKRVVKNNTLKRNYFFQKNFGFERAKVKKKKIAKMSQENTKTNVTDIFLKPVIDIVSNSINIIIQMM